MRKRCESIDLFEIVDASSRLRLVTFKEVNNNLKPAYRLIDIK